MTVYILANTSLINTILKLIRLLYIALPYYSLLTNGRPILITIGKPYRGS
jgi:hypothetical protein